MSDGILKEVLQLEQQIETALSKEQELAETWLAEACRAFDLELSCEQEGETLTAEKKSDEAIFSARRTAAQILRRERRRARTLVELPKERLLTRLDDQLKTVTTGRADDCPDDQS